ncbi:LacI family DNA-binding transcriptional regulator [Frigoribacterium sp. CFBP 8754]|uniref:LacI family DNA-binding transcriptional regulator n=1 Tax=unclassified Frigoribacterium TaxID=2627005 RepID=UPI0006FC0541|nr:MULTISPECIES: LacI family DNA-binding transcriptional regulator [unclassified Frigoribacterium]KQR44512.1 transcriptional regulator [Frigoribacterium sp. Leaf164]MBD8660738.1 LacI family DNA-binding transcriptional regulator [Frigoribacterium sp. CFBP 8754]MBD8728269.1 LacI family DNA-binding transcriptional regulator [Frigoribacterium sp. CFBP 13707]
MNAVTIKDVATRAGVSPATASRVLSGNPSTSAESRELVERAVRELDFRPNAQARALRSTRSDTVGLLVSDVRNPFFADLAHTIEQALLELGYVTLLGNANENQQQQDRYLDTLISRRVDGVIVAPQGTDSASIEALLAREVPTVFVDRTVPGLDVPSVTTDSGPGIRAAVRHLAELGHTRVGYIAGPQSVSTGRERLESWTAAIAEQGLSDDPALVHVGDFQSASGSAAVHAFLSLDEPPTAILAADSLMAVGAIAMLHRLDLRIGRDVAVVAFDDIEWFSLIDPALTVISHSVEDMGATAVALLQEVISGGRPESVTLVSELVIRASSSSPVPTPPRSLGRN